jgi:hypothetical protein
MLMGSPRPASSFVGQHPDIDSVQSKAGSARRNMMSAERQDHYFFSIIAPIFCLLPPGRRSIEPLHTAEYAPMCTSPRFWQRQPYISSACKLISEVSEKIVSDSQKRDLPGQTVRPKRDVGPGLTHTDTPLPADYARNFWLLQNCTHAEAL